MAAPLQRGSILHQKYQIHHVIGVNGHCIIYQGKDQKHDVIIKEYIYGNKRYENAVYRNQIEDLCIKDQKSFCKWKKKNEKYAKKEISNFHRYHQDVKEEILEEHHTYYLCIIGVKAQALTSRIITDRDMLFQISLKILESLQKLHDLGYVHLNLSLDKFLYTDDGNIMLIDFSSIQSVDHINNMQLCCRREYAPQEVLERMQYPMDISYHSDAIGFASDIYAVGIIFKKLSGNFVDEKKDHPFQKVLQKALCTNGKDRYQNIEEMRKDLIDLR